MAVRVLVLGGSRFLGRHVVAALLARGDEVTLLNRGVSDPNPGAGVELLHGDRGGDLNALRGRQWDVVIDTSGYVPRHVRASAAILSGAVERYLFISTIYVYRDLDRSCLDETAATAPLHDLEAERSIPATYGPLKAACEQTVQEWFPGRALVVRPGVLTGPLDHTDRLAYWLQRMARGGDAVAPAPADGALQLLDARDLAGWLAHLIHSEQVGTYNATGAQGALTWYELLTACGKFAAHPARPVWMEERFLLAKGLVPESGKLPFWNPSCQRSRGLFSIDSSLAAGAGLVRRPLDDTLRDMLTWSGLDRPLRVGLDRAEEEHLMCAWRASRSG